MKRITFLMRLHSVLQHGFLEIRNNRYYYEFNIKNLVCQDILFKGECSPTTLRATVEAAYDILRIEELV